ncbi:MAG: pitrilysin family protein [Pseudoxanthomonas suwonensis]|nr:pitrilysin family protein [Pseudoxanthomonas suwonensis]
MAFLFPARLRHAGLLLATAVLMAALPAAANETASITRGELVPVQTFTLDNGLDVVFHIDRSDPVVAVVLAAHVGSARETPGRTGFAHLFEHLFFLDSENLGYGGLDRMSARIGGSGANGSTSTDVTDYLQTVPNDALEKMIWAEADKLGYFINTVTDAVLAKEKQVVKNEKRQSVDNQPYGHTYAVLLEAMYPQGHPYSWPVIGSLQDLDAATLEDVRGFYQRWYSPNNATLVLAGDFDPVQARGWIEKYFGEIPRGPEASRAAPHPAALSESVRLMHEDNYARLPELTLAWPGVHQGHADAAALGVLAQYLTDGKDAPLNRVVIDEARVAPAVSASHGAQQLAGMFSVRVRGFEGGDLDQVRAAIDAGFAKFETDGVDGEALQRIKTMGEANLYGSMGSVLGKGRMLAQDSARLGDPAWIDTELQQLMAVSADDLMRVYRQYVADRAHVATSFVPRGQAALALSGSRQATVYEEPIIEGAEAAIDASAETPQYQRTPSSFDRSVEPPSGPAPVVTPPAIWNARLANGVQLSGIRNDELPLVNFQLSIDGGRLLDDPAKPGAASLTARMLDRGTAQRTPAELENAFKALGANVSVNASDEFFLITGSTLARNFAATLSLVTEMLTEPRWDATELGLAKDATTSAIQSARAQPLAIASRVHALVHYGRQHILSRHALGTERSVAALTSEDLAAYLARLSPERARLRVVGDIDRATAEAALAGLTQRWRTPATAMPQWPQPQRPERTTIHFYDMPNAAQSVLLYAQPAMPRAHADYYPASVANYRLGGGGFASRLMQQLREGKGYTYGAASGFSAGRDGGEFRFQSSVRSNVTLEAATLARDIIRDFATSFTAEDLDVTRSAMGKSRARAFETAGAKLGVLQAIGDYGLPADYLATEARVIEDMTIEQVQALARRWIDTDAMHIVIVGDAATQLPRLRELGHGEPVLVNDTVAEADR